MKTVQASDIEYLKNPYGFYNPKIKELDLPVRTYWTKSDIKWLNIEDIKETLYLVSKTTAKKIKEPIEENEPICGFTKVQNGYTALYNRPNAIGKIDKKYIYIIPEEKVIKQEIKTITRKYYFLSEIYNLFKELENKKLRFDVKYHFSEKLRNTECVEVSLHVKDFIDNDKFKYSESVLYIDNLHDFYLNNIKNVIEETDYPMNVNILEVDEFDYNKRYTINFKNEEKIYLFLVNK